MVSEMFGWKLILNCSIYLSQCELATKQRNKYDQVNVEVKKGRKENRPIKITEHFFFELNVQG
jgi:uncharacterized OsmC-like protein